MKKLVLAAMMSGLVVPTVAAAEPVRPGQALPFVAKDVRRSAPRKDTSNLIGPLLLPILLAAAVTAAVTVVATQSNG